MLSAPDEGGAVDPDDLAALATYPADDDHADEPVPLVSASNPPGTVTVSAYLNGTVADVELGPGVVATTEAELAEEIRVIADVAAKRATSAMHLFGVEILAAQGVDRDTAVDLMRQHPSLATPAEARAAEAGLAARYLDD